jgi:WD40 repeat protein
LEDIVKHLVISIILIALVVQTSVLFGGSEIAKLRDRSDINKKTVLNSPGSHGGFFSFAFSPDGKFVAGGTGAIKDAESGKVVGGGETVLWDASSGQLVRTLGSHGEGVTWVAFSRDGATLASASEDNRLIKLWSLPSGRLQQSRTLPIDVGDVKNLILGPNGSNIVIVVKKPTQEGTPSEYEALVWDARTGNVKWKLPRSNSSMVALSPDGSTLAAYIIIFKDRKLVSQEILICNAQTGQVVSKMDPGRNSPSGALAFLPDGKTLAGLAYRAVLLWNVSTGELTKKLQTELDSSNGTMAFSSDGKMLALASFMGDAIEVWDIAAGSPKGTLSFKFPNTIRHPAFSADLSRMACSQRGPAILDLTAMVPLNVTQTSRPNDQTDTTSPTTTSQMTTNISPGTNIQENRIDNTLQAEQNITKPDIDLNLIANIDPITEPNAVKKRVEMFQGLNEALKNIETQSDREITEWVNGLEEITTNITKAIYENIGEEYNFIKKQADEEKAVKTSTTIDGVALYRSVRFEKIVEKMQEEQMRREAMESRRSGRSSGRSRRSTRGRTGTRDTGYNNYNGGSRYQNTARRSSRRRSRDDMISKPSTPKVTMKLPFTDPNAVKAKIKTYEGLEKELKTVDRLGIREMRGWITKLNATSPILAKAVYQQVTEELKLTRKIAIEETAAKTTVAIDGLLVSRNERLGKLAKQMVEEKKKLRRAETRTSRTRTRR